MWCMIQSIRFGTRGIIEVAWLCRALKVWLFGCFLEAGEFSSSEHREPIICEAFQGAKELSRPRGKPYDGGGGAVLSKMEDRLWAVVYCIISYIS